MVVGKLVSFGVLLVAVYIGLKFHGISKVPPFPNLSYDQYWGPGKAPSSVDISVRPFRIKFSQEMITDLKVRLQQTRYTEPLEGTAFQYGFSHNYMKPIVDFWLNSYDFAKSEDFLNQLPQFKTNVQGLDIHFVHVKPNVGNQKVKVVPLLLLHGWPGSIREFYKIIPMLVEAKKNSDFVFEIIAPSLPGFGFSQGASKPGMGATQIGIIMKNLMQRLGHDKFYIQGGDWGAIIGATMTTLFQDNVLGYHSNFAILSTPLSYMKLFIGSFWPSMFVEEKFQHRLFPITSIFKNMLVETGYFHQQATKPDSVGLGLDNSPAGLAGWILEKFAVGTNIQSKYMDDGGLTVKFTYTELIDNLMLYWSTKSATTAARIYAESFNSVHLALGLDRIPTKVPMASARFPNELVFITEWQLKEKYVNLIQITDMPRGGHFAALEEPELLANDIRLAVLKFEAFHMKNSK